MTETSVGEADRLLARRYRMQRPVARRAWTTVWRGVDETLARPVCIKVLDRPDELPGGAQAFLDAAVAAGRLAHPRIASTYDADIEDGMPYVVSEWVEASPLAELLRSGTFPAPRATTIAAQVAEAVAYAHEHGVHHRDLRTGDVLVLADGSVKVTDFELGSVVAAGGGRQPGADPVTDDTQAVAAVLYACLTGRAVRAGEASLPTAPRRAGELCTPRQVRAGVPRDVDAVVTRALIPDRLPRHPALRTPEALLAELVRLPGDAGARGERVPPPAPVTPRTWPRWLRWGAPAAGVVGIGALALVVGLAVGEVPPPVTPFPDLASPTAAPGEQLTPVKPVAVRDFDPDGDGSENPSARLLAVDGDPSTVWETSKYRNSANLGGLKPGVGLVLDMGQPVALKRIDLTFATAGVSIEIRAANDVGAHAADFRLLAEKREAPQRLPVDIRDRTPARYYLVWVTGLVRADDGRFQAGIADIALLR